MQTPTQPTSGIKEIISKSSLTSVRPGVRVPGLATSPPAPRLRHVFGEKTPSAHPGHPCCRGGGNTRLVWNLSIMPRNSGHSLKGRDAREAVRPHHQPRVEDPLLARDPRTWLMLLKLPGRGSCIGFSGRPWETHRRHRKLCGCRG